MTRTTFPASPSDPNYYPFFGFVSSITNIARNLETMGLASCDISLPQPDVYKSNLEDGFNVWWKLYNDFSFDRESINNHSWNTQLLKDYALLFNLNDNKETLIALYQNHFSHLNASTRTQIMDLIKLVDRSVKVHESINSVIPGTKKAGALNKSPLKELYNVYLSIFIAHIQTASQETDLAPDSLVAKWDGTDQSSKLLLSRLESLNSGYSIKMEREIESFIRIKSQFAQLFECANKHQQLELRNAIIRWKLSELDKTINNIDLIQHAEEKLPLEINTNFLDELSALYTKVQLLSENIKNVVEEVSSLDVEVFNKTLLQIWNETKSFEKLQNHINTIHNFEQLKRFLSINISEEQYYEIDSIKVTDTITSETQYHWFKAIYLNLLENDRESLGESNYNICLQVLSKVDNDFENSQSPQDVIDVIQKKIEATKKMAQIHLANSQVIEYQQDTFAKLTMLAKQWDQKLEPCEIKILQEVIEDIGKLKVQFFYKDGKPKLLSDIRNDGDAVAFHKECYKMINAKAEEFTMSSECQNQLLVVLQAVVNYVVHLLSFGNVSNFFKNDTNEIKLIKQTVDDFKIKISSSDSQLNIEELQAEFDNVPDYGL